MLLDFGDIGLLSVSIAAARLHVPDDQERDAESASSKLTDILVPLAGQHRVPWLFPPKHVRVRAEALMVHTPRVDDKIRGQARLRSVLGGRGAPNQPMRMGSARRDCGIRPVFFLDPNVEYR